MKESYIESNLCSNIKNIGGLCLKFVSPGNAGVPDRIILLPDGRVRFIELKTETGRLAPIQRAWIDKLRRMGFDAQVLYGTEDVKKYVAQLSEESSAEDH